MQYVNKTDSSNIKTAAIPNDAAVVFVNNNDKLCVQTADNAVVFTEDAPVDGNAYIRKDGKWETVPTDTEDISYMYYGYVKQTNLDAAIELTDAIVNAAISAGTLKKTVTADNMVLPIVDIPAGSFILVLVPDTHKAMLNNAGVFVEFDPDRVLIDSGANGDSFTLVDTVYSMYSEFCLSDASVSVQIKRV